MYGFHADFRFGPIIAVGLACLRRVYGMPTCEWSAAGGGGYGFRKILGQQNTLLRERGSEAISFSPFPRVLWCTSVYVAQKTILEVIFILSIFVRRTQIFSGCCPHHLSAAELSLSLSHAPLEHSPYIQTKCAKKHANAKGAAHCSGGYASGFVRPRVLRVLDERPTL